MHLPVKYEVVEVKKRLMLKDVSEYIIVDHNTTTYKQMQMRCKCSPVSGHLLTPVQVILTREPCVSSGLDSGECSGNNRKQPTMSVNEAALQSASNIKSFSYIV